MIEFVRAATEEEIYDIVENGEVIGFIKKTDNDTFPWLSQYRIGEQNYQLMAIDLEGCQETLTGILSGEIETDPAKLPKIHVDGPPGPEDEIQESEVVQ